MPIPSANLFRRLRAAALILSLVFSFLPAAAQTTAPAPARPPVQWPRSRDYDVEHYRIQVSFDWREKAVSGETTITLRPFQDGLKEVQLDAGEMQIASVRLPGGQPLAHRYEDNQKLYVTLDRAYSEGAAVSFTVAYRAVPKRGLTFITPTESDPNRPYQIWSQGQAEDNHYWFPCYDYPNDRATSELIATVEDDYQVISNGKLVSVTSHAAKKMKTWHWKIDKPFSSYLISIIVGQFAEIKDQHRNVPILSYVYRDQVENGRLTFENTAKMMAFFEEFTGVPYPFEEYKQTTVRDFGGGMENTTATTLTDTIVYDRRGALDRRAGSDGLIAHELAHSWFGNMITCRDWGELWLNESFATYLESAWLEHHVGRDEYHYEMFSNQRAYFQTWAINNRRPIATRLYAHPDAIFDAYPYQRGAAVVGMLRFVLGDQLFLKAIRHYVKKHQWQVVETQQLVAAIEEATGQNLQWFFDQWIYQMGHPEFEITQNYDDSAKRLTLTVKQKQKPDPRRSWYKSPDFFRMPVDIALTTAAGEKVHRVWVDQREKVFTFDVDSKPLIINFDRGNQIIKEVSFYRTEEELAYQLLNDRDVMGRVRAAIELRGRRTPAALAALAKAATTDAFGGVRLEAVTSLSGATEDSARLALRAAAKDRESRVRRAAIQGLGVLRDAKLADLFIAATREDESYFVVADAAQALGSAGGPKAFDVLTGLLNQPSWQDTIRAGALQGLAALKDARGFEFGLRYSAPGYRPEVRSAAIQLIGATGAGKEESLPALVAALKDPSLQIRFSAVQAIGLLGDFRAVPALEEAAKAPDLPPYGRPIINSVLNRLRRRF